MPLDDGAVISRRVPDTATLSGIRVAAFGARCGLALHVRGRGGEFTKICVRRSWARWLIWHFAQFRQRAAPERIVRAIQDDDTVIQPLRRRKVFAAAKKRVLRELPQPRAVVIR